MFSQRWRPALAAAVGALALGCSSGGQASHASRETSGTLGLELITSSGAILQSVGYTLTGPAGFSLTGSVDVTQSTTISAVIGGLPTGRGYQLTLRAASVDGQTQCAGAAVFDIGAGATTPVPVTLECRGPNQNGSVSVSATFQFCPVLDSALAVPTAAVVGARIELQSLAHDPDPGPDPLTYSWSATSGTVKASASPNAIFTCTAPGTATVNLAVSDGSPDPACAAIFSVDVACSSCGPDGATCADGNECTVSDTCRANACVGTFAPARTVCKQNELCDGNGECVECLVANDCPGSDTPCSTRTCSAGVCGAALAAKGARTPPQTAGDCHAAECDGQGRIVSVIDDTDVPVDQNACTADSCKNGVASNPPVAAETSCESSRVCDGAGKCVDCVAASDCRGQDTSCAKRTCLANLCATANTAEGASCTETGGQLCDGIGSCVVPSFRVVRIGDGTTPLGSSSARAVVEQRKLDGTLLGTLSLPTSAIGANQPFSLMGLATTEGCLARSVDGRYLMLTGYAAAPGVASISATAATAVKRIVARISATGAIDTSTQLGGAFGFGSPRSAVSLDGSAFWLSGAGAAAAPATTPAGVWYAPFGSSDATQLFATSLRTLGMFGSQLYGASDAAPGPDLFTIGSGLATSGTQTALQLPGMPKALGASPWSFALLDRSPTIAGVDTLYVADDRSVTGRGVQKWAFEGQTWILKSTFNLPTATGIRGLAALTTGSNITLVVTTSDSGNQQNRIVVFVDDGSASPTGTVIATSPANTVYRGVAPNLHQ